MVKEKEKALQQLSQRQHSLEREVALYRDRLHLITQIIRQLMLKKDQGDSIDPSLIESQLAAIFGTTTTINTPSRRHNNTEGSNQDEDDENEIAVEDMEELNMAIEGLEEAKQQLHWIKKR